MSSLLDANRVSIRCITVSTADLTPRTIPLEYGMYTDETLTCVDCNAAFIFSAGEQEFFAQKGFANKPNRCPDCRAARKANKGGGGGGGNFSGGGGYGGGGGGARRHREMFQATCSGCGKIAEVPFQPRGDKPVYCRECFSSRQAPRY